MKLKMYTNVADAAGERWPPARVATRDPAGIGGKGTRMELSVAPRRCR